jgi:hypothetical protein
MLEEVLAGVLGAIEQCRRQESILCSLPPFVAASFADLLQALRPKRRKPDSKTASIPFRSNGNEFNFLLIFNSF